MHDLNFARVAERVRTGAGNEGLSHFLKSAARAAQTDTAYLSVRANGWTSIMASYQLPIQLLAGWKTEPALEEKFRTSFISSRFREEGCGPRGAVSSGDSRWNYVVNVPILMPRISGIVSITCCDLEAPRVEYPFALPIIKNIGTAVSNFLRLIEQLTGSVYPDDMLAPLTGVKEPDQGYALNGIPAGESSMVTGEFLLGTLVKRRLVCSRGDISYSSLRQWRAPVKAYQIAALKALKRDLPDRFVDIVAGELAHAGSQIAGSRAFDKVVGVACGHSGPRCLSERLSVAVARDLGIAHEEMFEPLPAKGTSHPKANVGRPRMRCRTEPDGRYLVIDDVATSGTHISEATRLLRTEKASAVPLVWIAG